MAGVRESTISGTLEMNVSGRHRQAVGWLAVFGSAFCFYFATVIIRWSTFFVEIEAAYFVFCRLLLGFIVVCLIMLINRKGPVPRNYHYLIGRMIANTVAVFCFYKAVEVCSLAEANILNMTYPLFVALFTLFFLKEQRDMFSFLIVVVAFAGIWLILSPGDIEIRWSNAWGLASGITAAAAMVYLNLSRKLHDSHTVLFFMFGLGSLVIYLLFRSSIFIPDLTEFLFLFICSAAGVLGQYLLTYGYYFVTAVEGSVISSSRILLAALLGPALVADPALNIAGWCGALLIFVANVVLAVRRSKTRPL